MKELIFKYLTQQYGTLNNNQYAKLKSSIDIWILYRIMSTIFAIDILEMKTYVNEWLKLETKRRRQAKQGFRIVT